MAQGITGVRQPGDRTTRACQREVSIRSKPIQQNPGDAWALGISGPEREPKLACPVYRSAGLLSEQIRHSIFRPACSPQIPPPPRPSCRHPRLCRHWEPAERYSRFLRLKQTCTTPLQERDDHRGQRLKTTPAVSIPMVSGATRSVRKAKRLNRCAIPRARIIIPRSQPIFPAAIFFRSSASIYFFEQSVSGRKNFASQ
jgi:hypothetical protein